MPFPMTISLELNALGSIGVNKQYKIQLSTPTLTLIGPNGSGKTQLLRCFKSAFLGHIGQKKVRFISAGRIGLQEQYRSDYDGYRGGVPPYEQATFGSRRDSERRHNFETITGDYQTLSVRPDILIKVQERLKKLFNRSLFLEWDAGNLKVMFKRNDQNTNPYSASREASGLLHLIAILSALYDDDVGALLLDEPEISLHPQLQSFLMREIKKQAGDPETGKKIIVIATHSTEFIDIKRTSDLPSLLFCYDLLVNPIQIDANAPELENRKIKELIARMGQEHRLAFFCKRPLLVEGPSDAIICSGIDRILDLYLEASGVQILPVIGKGEIPIVHKFLTMIGKEPIVLTDADSFTDSIDLIYTYTNSERGNKVAQARGFADCNTFVKSLHSDFCTIVDSKIEKYKEILEHHNYWVNKKSTDDPKIVYRRSFFSSLFSDKAEIIDAFDNDNELMSLRTRLISLLALLEELGCFILRRGTIESYYLYVERNTSSGKPIAAIDEIEKIESMTKVQITKSYREIVACLIYSTRRKPIREVESLRELLLAVLAPVLANLSADTTQYEIDTVKRNIIGDRSSLFNISVVPEKKSSLLVSINSSILETDCFPFEIEKSDNLVMIIDSKLKLS